MKQKIISFDIKQLKGADDSLDEQRQTEERMKERKQEWRTHQHIHSTFAYHLHIICISFACERMGTRRWPSQGV